MDVSQFEIDYNSGNDGLYRANYNLAVSIRDLKLWDAGIRPHRHWRLKHVKDYFGVTGNAKSILKQLNHIQNG